MKNIIKLDTYDVLYDKDKNLNCIVAKTTNDMAELCYSNGYVEIIGRYIESNERYIIDISMHYDEFIKDFRKTYVVIYINENEELSSVNKMFIKAKDEEDCSRKLMYFNVFPENILYCQEDNNNEIIDKKYELTISDESGKIRTSVIDCRNVNKFEIDSIIAGLFDQSVLNSSLGNSYCGIPEFDETIIFRNEEKI